MRYFVLMDGKAGGYGVVVPDLPGCTAMGDTIDAALANAAEALRDWVEVTIESGGKVPAPHSLEALRKDPEVVAALSGGASIASAPLIRDTGKPTRRRRSGSLQT